MTRMVKWCAVCVVMLFGCTNEKRNVIRTDLPPADSANAPADPIERRFWGHRFRIEGDFNGDGRKEWMVEKYVDPATGKEVDKYAEDPFTDLNMDLAYQDSIIAFFICGESDLDTLWIRRDFGHFGASFAKNEGDLDGDGGDELSFVGNWADYSGINSYRVMTYKKGKWSMLLRFMIRDFEIPPLPCFKTQAEEDSAKARYYRANRKPYPSNDSFRGRIRPIKPHIIEISSLDHPDDAGLNGLARIDLRKVKDAEIEQEAILKFDMEE